MSIGTALVPVFFFNHKWIPPFSVSSLEQDSNTPAGPPRGQTGNKQVRWPGDYRPRGLGLHLLAAAAAQFQTIVITVEVRSIVPDFSIFEIN